MKNHKHLAVLIGVVVSVLSVASFAAADKDLKVVIIRHGEKPAEGDNLSCQGENRALQLPAVLYKKFNKPDYTYVPNLDEGKSTNHARMFQTLVPFAVKYNLTINTKYKEKDYSDFPKDVLKKTGTVLIAWEHSGIPPLAESLGVKKAPAWPDNDFDSIWIITYPNGKATLVIDSEGITPSADCPF